MRSGNFERDQSSSTRPEPRLSASRLQRSVLRTFDARSIITPHVSAVIPAAGLGSRFMSGWKILAPGSIGRPVLLRVLDVVSDFVEAPTVVIPTAAVPEVRRAIQETDHKPLLLEHNSFDGPWGAVTAGMEAKKDFAGDVLVIWGDMGTISERIVLLAYAFHLRSGSIFTFPTKLRRSPYVSVVRDESMRVVSLAAGGANGSATHETDCGVFWMKWPDMFEQCQLVRDMFGSDGGLDKLIELLAHSGTHALGCRVARLMDSQGVNTIEELRRADYYYLLRTSQELASLAAAEDPRALANLLATLNLCPETESALGELSLELLQSALDLLPTLCFPSKIARIRRSIGV